MNKTYNQSTIGKIILFCVLVLEISLVINAYRNHEILWFVFGIFGSAILTYAFFTAGVFLRITVYDEGIRVDSKKLMKPKELSWHEIGMIVDDSWLGIHLYHLVPESRQKKRITIPCFIADYKDLLFEVVKKVPDLKVEPTVKELVSRKRI